MAALLPHESYASKTLRTLPEIFQAQQQQRRQVEAVIGSTKNDMLHRGTHVSSFDSESDGDFISVVVEAEENWDNNMYLNNPHPKSTCPSYSVKENTSGQSWS